MTQSLGYLCRIKAALAVKKSNILVSHTFLTIFSYLLMSRKYVYVANQKYVLDQREAFSDNCMVVIGFHFLLQSSDFYWSIGLVFFESGNSIVSLRNSWCPWVGPQRSRSFYAFYWGQELLFIIVLSSFVFKELSPLEGLFFYSPKLQSAQLL